MLPAHPLPEDPIDLAHASWKGQGWENAADGMAVVTSIMRVQQVLLAQVEAVLRPLGLTFARYEVLMLLLFSRTGSPACGQDRRTAAGPSRECDQRRATAGARRIRDRAANPADGRSVLAEITESGRRLTDVATPRSTPRSSRLCRRVPRATRDLRRPQRHAPRLRRFPLKLELL